MSVLGLAIKATRGGHIETVPMVRCFRGHGILGDANARQDSARQVLIAGADVYDDLEMPTGALRENILVDGNISQWRSGQLVCVGQSVLRLTFPCEVCRKLNGVRPDLARELVDRRGMLARVVTSGQVDVGSRIEVLSRRLPSIPTHPRARIYDLLSKVPRGRVVTCMAAIAVLGLLKGYARVIPRVLKDAPEDTPVHRMVATDRSLMERHLPGQRRWLSSEGVEFDGERVRERSLWDAERYFGHEA